MTGPSIAAEPRTVNNPRTNGVVLNARCVSIRWKPTVTPSPVSTYMIRNTKMSFQPSHWPQTCQPTISRQRTGTTVTVPVMIRSSVSFSQGSTSSTPRACRSASSVIYGGHDSVRRPSGALLR